MSSVSPVREKSRKLYIGGLVENVVKEDLSSELIKYGEIVDLWIARNPPGFAFVEYEKISDAEKAVRGLDGISICGSKVRVEFAHGGHQKSGGFRGGASRGGGRPGRRYNNVSPRRGRFSPPPTYDGIRHPYEQLSALYSQDIAAAAAAAGFPYALPGYPPVLPFLPSEEFIRSLQRQTRRAVLAPVYRDRSPGLRRRSRSPVDRRQFRDRSPSITYNGRAVSRRGVNSRGNPVSTRRRDDRNGYSHSPPPGRYRDDSRSKKSPERRHR